MGKSFFREGLLSHLEALRRTLWSIIIVFSLFLIPGWFAAPPLLSLLLDFAAPKDFQLHYFSLMEPFLVRLEVSLFAALLTSLPFSLWFLWRFIAPGLKPTERSALRLPLILSWFLAAAGAAVAYFLIVPSIISFSVSFAARELSPLIGLENFVSLTLTLMVAGMAIFQFPLVVYALLACGVTSLDAMKKKRHIVIVIILIAAAVLTPPDVASQLLLAVPTWLLFEASLLIFRWKFPPRGTDALPTHESGRENP